MGSGTFGLPVLDALAASRHEVAAVVTAPDKPQGRGRVLTPSPIKVWADAKKISALTPSKLNTPETIAQLKSAGADVFVVASYGALLSEEVLALPPRGCVNVHPSLLPLYRGASPVVQALLDGRTRTGMTIMAMAKDLDAGDILLQKGVEAGTDEDARGLTDRLARMGGEMTVQALDLLEAGKLERVPQDHKTATYCSKLKKEHGRIDWTAPARVVHDHVRALVIWPGSFTTRNGKQIKVLKTRLVASDDTPSEPGRVLGTRAPGGLIVKCGDGPIAIEELQPEGGRPMHWKDFVNGSSIKPGDRFE
jgi:methionyl-tRNA formyltransferase